MTQLNPNKRKILMAPKSPAPVFPIVGIGASAGGLEAFGQFFRHASGDSGMAFVLVPLDQIPIKPGIVYVIPPNRDTAIFHGVLQLTVSCC